MRAIKRGERMGIMVVKLFVDCWWEFLTVAPEVSFWVQPGWWHGEEHLLEVASSGLPVERTTLLPLFLCSSFIHLLHHFFIHSQSPDTSCVSGCEYGGKTAKIKQWLAVQGRRINVLSHSLRDHAPVETEKLQVSVILSYLLNSRNSLLIECVPCPLQASESKEKELFSKGLELTTPSPWKI